ncbi:MAG: MBL fold metallo-hydrolase [Christensenellales bacterium]|jgi:7,8-dihydropterin-6-yl-methyl-4-(beta-D-ribofuranosyl)aminobenzene 5'-phosphate synthase
MDVTVLMENTCGRGLEQEHGLSLHISYNGKNILFDTGASSAFMRNADKLGIDLSAVDFCVISHGHYDHTGGLPAFLQANEIAKVYIKSQAGGDYRSGLFRYIGMERSLLKKWGHRFLFVEQETQPMAGCVLLPKVCVQRQYRTPNKGMLQRRGILLRRDLFDHEMMMALDLQDGIALFTGCSHSGVTNMVDTAIRALDKRVQVLFGGFHLGDCEEEYIEKIGMKLKTFNIERIYTGHCTGDRAFSILKGSLRQLQPLCAGLSVAI